MLKLFEGLTPARLLIWWALLSLVCLARANMLTHGPAVKQSALGVTVPSLATPLGSSVPTLPSLVLVLGWLGCPTVADGLAATEGRLIGPAPALREAGAGCRRPLSQAPARQLQAACARFPLARGARFRVRPSGRRSGSVNSGSPQGGNQRRAPQPPQLLGRVDRRLTATQSSSSSTTTARSATSASRQRPGP